MKSETIFCVVALLLGMLLANMFQNVCGCKNIEGSGVFDESPGLVPGSTPPTQPPVPDCPACPPVEPVPVQDCPACPPVPDCPACPPVQDCPACPKCPTQ